MSSPRVSRRALSLELARGDSDRRSWPFWAHEPNHGISIGSAPECRWRVDGPGVAQVHVMLYWDGAALWLSNVASTVVRLGSRTIEGWTPLGADLRIEFGEALLLVQASPAPRASRPVTAPPVPRLVELEGDAVVELHAVEPPPPAPEDRPSRWRWWLALCALAVIGLLAWIGSHR